MGRPTAPTLIGRELLVRDETPDAAGIEAVVNFQRQGSRIILVAPRPHRWRPTRRSVDHDLALQQQIHQLISRAGAELDGVLYLGTGMFSDRPADEDEFSRLAARYDRNVDELVLISSDQSLLDAIIKAGGSAVAIGRDAPDAIRHFDDLNAALNHLTADT